MDKFERQFETLDVQTNQMEEAMGSTTTLMTPQVLRTSASLVHLPFVLCVFRNTNLFTAHFLFQGQVDSLLHEMADEAG